MVGRCHHHAGLGVDGVDAEGRVGHTGRGVSTCWLQQHLLCGDVGQLLQHEATIGLVGHHQDVLFGADGQ